LASRWHVPVVSKALRHALANPGKCIYGAALPCCIGEAGSLQAACKPEAVVHAPASAQHNQPSREACASALRNISRVPLSWQTSPVHVRPQHPTAPPCVPQRSWRAASHTSPRCRDASAPENQPTWDSAQQASRAPGQPRRRAELPPGAAALTAERCATRPDARQHAGSAGKQTGGAVSSRPRSAPAAAPGPPATRRPSPADAPRRAQRPVAAGWMPSSMLESPPGR